jgi:uncharacterized protein (TIGR02588 family)
MGVSDVASRAGGSLVQRIPLWEWVLAALGGVMLLGVVGYITYHGIAYPEAPPEVVVEALGASPSGAGYLVRFRARNGGNRTASALRISGHLLRDGRPVETSETILDYLPQQSQRQGGLFFTENPANGRLVLRAEGYLEP